MNKTFMLSLIITTAIIALAAAVTITNIAITPFDGTSPTTEDALLCSWQPTGATSQTISWYNGSTRHSLQTVAGTINTSTLGAHIAQKGQQWTCNVTATNGTHTVTKTRTVTIKNALPSPPNASDQTLYEDHSKTIPMTSTDADGDSITYTKLTSEPTYCSIGSSSGIITCNPTASHIGAVNGTWGAWDGGSYQALANSTYTVVEVNDQPLFSPSLTNKNATEETLFNYSITVTDEESDYPIAFSIATNLSNISIHTLSSTQAYITFTHESRAPVFRDKGYWFVTVNATDTGSSNTTPYDNPTRLETFYLTVITVNQEPIITTNVSAISGTQGQQLIFTVNATDQDTEDTLSFDITAPGCSVNPWIITTTNSSHNASGLVDQALNNNHIICRYINITVTDQETIDWVAIMLNLTNTNDAPTVHELSYNPRNTQINISNLSAVKGRTFTYWVNATDPDSQTYEGETLSYSDNTSLFDINASGAISFLVTDVHLGTHKVLINVTDDENNYSSRAMTLTFQNNTAPVLNSIGTLNCTQDIRCTKIVIATDPDLGEVLDFNDDSALFSITQLNATAANISFIPTNSQVGIYSVNISVFDQFSFYDHEIITINITNINDPPFFDQDKDNVTDAITFGKIVEGSPYTARIEVTDFDLFLGLDSLTYSVSYLTTFGGFEHNLTITENGSDYFIIAFLPNSSQVGTHHLNISVTDSAHAVDWQNVTLEVLVKTDKPTFSRIRPYRNGSTTYTGYGNASCFPSHTSTVNFTENTTVTFDALMRNDTSISANYLNYRWYYNDALMENLGHVAPGINSSFQVNFDYFSNGTHTVRLRGIDQRYSYRDWTWTVNISDVNRPPIMAGYLTNITLNSSLTIENYFSYRGGFQRFYDPDEDLNEDGYRGLLFGEGTYLSYALVSNNCSQASMAFSGDNITLTPLKVGTCLVRFKATDPYDESVQSNTVWITVTDIIMEEVEVQTSSGGSSTTTPRIVPLPFEEPVETPVPFDLIVPEEVSTYENETIKIPIMLINTWNDTLINIKLNATSHNASAEHVLWFDKDIIEQLLPGENVSLNLYVEHYRQDSPFTVTVTAKVDNPEFEDSAVILINALEQTNSGEDIISKVTFARDLLNDNPECQELNELLDRADEFRLAGNYDQAIKLINTVVNGCKYIINSEKDPTPEHPKDFYTFSGYISRNLTATIILGTIMAILTGFGIAMIVTRNKGEDA